MITVRKTVEFVDQSVLLYVDLAFNQESGVYCYQWEVFRAPETGHILKVDNLKHFDVHLLPADDLIALAKEIEAIINHHKNDFGSFNAFARAVSA